MDIETTQQIEEDLSITLLERRKRLHVLATEINNWEDQETKNPNYLETISTPPQNPNVPSTSILSFDRSLSANNNSFYSPKSQQMNANKSPALKHQPPSPYNSRYNKENSQTHSSSSPSKRKLAESNTSSSHLSSSEILNVAHRILSKNQSNSAMAVTQPKVMKTSNNTNKESFSTGSISNIRSKFENKRNDSSDGSILMTPKSIIKKFEQMSRDGGVNRGSNSNPVSAQTSLTNLKTSTSSLDSAPHEAAKQQSDQHVASIFPSLKAIQTNQPATSASTTNHIYSEHIHPKSIIEKFEQMVKNNGQQIQAIEVEQITTMPKSISSNTNFSSISDACRGSGSLTYISSVISDASPREFENDDDSEEEDEDINDHTYKTNHTEADELYEELSNETETQKAYKDAREDFAGDNTSLFEEENSTTTESRTENPETYSLSSSYSGSCINKDFDDIEDSATNDDLTNTDIYSEYTETEQTYDDGAYQISSTASYSPSEKEFNQHVNIEPIPNDNTKINKLSLVPPKSPLKLVQRSPAKSSSTSVTGDDQSEPLYSIKEYRKQKKHVASGLPASSYRRSSVSSALRPKEDNGEKLKKALQQAKQQAATHEAPNSEDVNLKKSKYLERIKELEELIKQEDNVIHQTGIALERCLTDSLFTGSSEHIECNRILLISCQKRQAYSAEISRLKQLISILVNKKPVQPVQPATVDEYSGYSDMSSVDLTGLLIFSDLQLPIKESYLNKLKSGDERRIFYFLCLIRNGIQVLQTQVISVQELIAKRDTSITFPNRMAISNVDVNFKVKIDIYTLEITPKEVKNSKSNTLASTSKFFSPFKNSLFHSSSDSSSSSGSAVSNSNHHYNENSSLGVSLGGSKTSNFIHIDTIEITNKDLSSNRFKLSISSSSIPLTGVLFVTVRCMPSKSIELKGFMTLLEDVDGLRSWDRRWCFLNNYNISYWKYPEDEYKTSPLGIIDLTKCVSDKVVILPRDMCARKYTFELAIGDADMDKRYRLSADTKDQANDWLTNVNYALANLKLWNPKSAKKPATLSNI